MRPCLLDLTPDQYPVGETETFRRKQMADWIFSKRVTSFDAMLNLPASMRHELAERYSLDPVAFSAVQGSRDTTRKYLWQLRDGNLIESVLIPASPALYGSRSDRRTLCVSTQVGCAYGCKFCASGLDGWKRNLTPGEIIGQVMAAEKHSGDKVNNLVFMGMGEPLANYESLLKAIEMLNAPWGLNMGARHITVSTSGLAPQIRDLAQQPRQIQLALSLHGATDEVRGKIMPVNRKYPLEVLLDACEAFQEAKGRMMTLEYILIAGINDAMEQARLLAGHARRLHAKINLIPYNKVEGLQWQRPTDSVIKSFAAEVKRGGAQATVRLEKGHDIDAACGQLRLRTERERRESTETT